jgi:hypothetical protein
MQMSECFVFCILLSLVGALGKTIPFFQDISIKNDTNQKKPSIWYQFALVYYFTASKQF